MESEIKKEVVKPNNESRAIHLVILKINHSNKLKFKEGKGGILKDRNKKDVFYEVLFQSKIR